MKKFLKLVSAILATVILAAGLLALRIYLYRNTSPDVVADAAVVLGAAVWGKDVSPVFRERINHAISLYHSGKVRQLIFTGGQGNPGEQTEAAAARDYAIYSGVSAGDILLEEKSHTTYENILYAREVAKAHGVTKVLIVSDPLHMKRALTMATDVGFDAYPSPTPTTRFESARSQAVLLAHETYYYIGYLLRRPFLHH